MSHDQFTAEFGSMIADHREQKAINQGVVRGDKLYIKNDSNFTRLKSKGRQELLVGRSQELRRRLERKKQNMEKK